MRVLEVFPFDFGDPDVWPVMVRVVLWVAVVGALIGIIANVAALLRTRDAG